jgi:hypothetical protein
MPKPYNTWTVTPHGPIEKVHDNFWRVEAPFPGAPFKRVMALARLADGRILVHNAIALGDAEMKEIEAWGKPAILLVPNGGHRMDAKIWKDRYPDARVIAPPGARAKVAEIVKVDEDGTSLGDQSVRYEILEGTKEREGVLTVKSGAETTLVFNDALMNMHSLPGFGGFMMGLIGFTGPALKVSFPARMAIVADKKALRAHLERLAGTDGLARIDVCHGEPVTEKAAVALRTAAAAL